MVRIILKYVKILIFFFKIGGLVGVMWFGIFVFVFYLLEVLVLGIYVGGLKVKGYLFIILCICYW